MGMYHQRFAVSAQSQLPRPKGVHSNCQAHVGVGKVDDCAPETRGFGRLRQTPRAVLAGSAHRPAHLPDLSGEPFDPRVDGILEILQRHLTASELDSAIRDAVEKCEDGIDEKIVRLVVRDIPRHVARELDQKALRDYKRRALHFHLDARRPEMMRLAASGAPGRRPTLRETVESYIGKRTLAPGVDRDALVQLGTFYLQEADAAASVASAGSPPTLGG